MVIDRLKMGERERREERRNGSSAFLPRLSFFSSGSFPGPPPSAGGRLLRKRTPSTHNPAPPKRQCRTNTTPTAPPTPPPPSPPPDPINPWQYCNLCWERGTHFAQHCPHPPRPRPEGFHKETKRLKPNRNVRRQNVKRKSAPESSDKTLSPNLRTPVGEEGEDERW